MITVIITAIERVKGTIWESENINFYTHSLKPFNAFGNERQHLHTQTRNIAWKKSATVQAGLFTAQIDMNNGSNQNCNNVGNDITQQQQQANHYRLQDMA